MIDLNGENIGRVYLGSDPLCRIYCRDGLDLGVEREWTPPPPPPPHLKFTSQQDNSTVGYTINGTVNKDIYTSIDGQVWIPWDGSNIALNNGQGIYVWNKTNTLNTGWGSLKFIMSGSIAASGNVDSMINFSELTVSCYQGLFNGCAALTTAPVLPATTLTTSCYQIMFQNCTSLTIAPELPATQLAQQCYAFMFYNCTALIAAPNLPATTLAHNCYVEMFEQCTNLNSIKISYTGNFNRYFSNWVSGISSTGTFYYNGSDTTRGASAIPSGWTVQTFAA